MITKKDPFSDSYYVLNTFEEEETCPFCHKNYICSYQEQQPGCRSGEDKVCPYCGEILTKNSFSYEFVTYKKDDNI